MNPSSRPLLLTAAALAAVPAISFAQPTAHYVPGVEGIKAASLPPPGFYLRDYNVMYFANQLNGPDGHGIDPADAKAFIYANVPRLVWITPVQFLGGNLGIDALLPLQYTDLQANTPMGRFDDHTFGVGDFFAEGTWSWHVEHFDVSVAYGVWAPTGDSSGAPISTLAGSGYWSQMITAGATWYPDKEKKFSVSALSRYEFNSIDGDTGVRPGQAYTLEWGVGYAPTKTLDVGVVGYFQQQTTQDSPPSAAGKDHVVALGPEVSLVWPKIALITSLRYLYEVSAADRLQGQTVTLTLTKRF